MNFLLDTHAFLWFIAGDDKLSPTARELIEEPTNQPLFSAASLWEIAIKVSIGKLSLAQPFATFIPEQLALNGINLLGIELEHTAVVSTLPFHHRDPFDRLLIAQAMVEKMPLISVDHAFGEYAVKVLW